MALTTAHRDWYYDQIEAIAADTVMLDRSKNLLTYHSEIRSDESHTKSADPEELAHAVTLALLCSAKYKYPRTALWHEKHFAHGSKGSHADEVDILIEDGDGLPYALWELKATADFNADREDAIKNQLFGTAPLVGAPRLLVYATVRPSGAKASLHLECIDYTKYKSYEAWVDAGRPQGSTFPADYRDLDYEPFVNGGKLDLKLDCTQSDFRAVAATFHNEFFGEHPDNTLFVNLVKCLLAKIHDEKTTKTDDVYQFQILNKTGKPETAREVFKRVNALYASAYDRYIDPGTTEKDEINPKEFSEERVKAVVQALQGMSITKGAALHGDVIGAFFEEILRSGFKQDKGMYFTHDNIVRFMVEAIDLRGLALSTWRAASHPENRLPYVVDPACGSGTFLLHAMHTITAAIRDAKADLVNDFDSEQFFNARMSDAMPNYWAENFIYGLDPKFIMAITAKVNMVLHGDGSAHIFKDDAFKPLSGLRDTKFRPAPEPTRAIPKARYKPEVSETFDLVISNPPFGVTIPADSRTKLSTTFALSETNPSEALFLERCFQLLKPCGRLALVVPESLLNSSDLQPARMFLYRAFHLRAIVSLPRNVFIDTPTLTSLLFAQKKSAAEIEKWDAAWDATYSAAETKVKAARLLLKKEALETQTPAGLQKGIVAALSPPISLTDWVLKSGKEGAVLTFALPPSIKTTTDAATHYTALLRTAGFEALIVRHVFEQVAKQLDVQYPAFMVEEVGFKLSKRKEKVRPNQLCAFRVTATKQLVTNLHTIDDNYEVVVSSKQPKTVLDFLRREVKWL